MWFLVHSPDRHPKFWNIVTFPLAPVGFAQTCQYPLAFVLDRTHQVVFLCLFAPMVMRGGMLHRSYLNAQTPNLTDSEVIQTLGRHSTCGNARFTRALLGKVLRQTPIGKTDLRAISAAPIRIGSLSGSEVF